MSPLIQISYLYRPAGGLCSVFYQPVDPLPSSSFSVLLKLCELFYFSTNLMPGHYLEHFRRNSSYTAVKVHTCK